MYADDGVLYSNEPIHVGKVKAAFAELGLELSEEKSGFVKTRK